ncbi:MAG TPA: hypothetical protein VIB99_03635, partial [Candidatus Limnocylindrales bacterium]
YTIPASGTTAAAVWNFRDLTNPLLNTLTFLGGKTVSWLPPIPLFEFTLGLIVIVGGLYYLVAGRSSLDVEQVTADAATGEATIG